MEHVSHFTYGWINPIMAFGFAFAGSILALMCMTQARRQDGTVKSARKRVQWIALAAFALGGTAIWMMHFTAMIGFKVVESDIAYDPFKTFLSLVASIGAVFFGLLVAGTGRKGTVGKILIAGPLTGIGVVIMHYSGMAAINVSGHISHDRDYFIASVVVAVVAATAALFCGMYLDGWRWQTAAAVIMGIAVCSMHYTGMAGVRVTVYDEGLNAVPGIDPIMLILPILGVATIGIIVLLFALMGTQPKMVTKRDQLGIEVGDDEPLPTSTGAIPVERMRSQRPRPGAGRVRNRTERSSGYVPDQRTAPPVAAPLGSNDGPPIVPDRPGSRAQRSFQQADLGKTAEHFDITRQSPRQ
ncbi:MHYT domain-containing protein [Glycomyces harbinensis]|uniref:MHYT domain-containing protein, NO-binding membrane sensor n=1 Tax=Glycomyces harbinensis TaxID=58114 RepID=A0A1G7CIV8_9ACTN|nr:MHYT domain-containing protein [Glycomyces harbinensis]SDE39249.1 MHYT domain-containing protein, NO-binding membrane sensor [Glycomyces harbinensis]